MAKLKRNAIELVTGVTKDDELETKVYYTGFIPMSVVYEALDFYEDINDKEVEISEKEMLDQLADFVARKAYAGQFTKEDLINGLHAPQAQNELLEQLMFVTQGRQSEASKKLVENKKTA